MLSGLFRKKRSPEPLMVVASLNARLQPLHRGEFFEDPLDVKLKEVGLGEVTGGGTMQASTGEIEYCDIEILLKDADEAAIARLISMMEDLGAPKGSKLLVESFGVEREFGLAEGLAVYLNGTGLPAETYQNCDSNFVYSEFDRILVGLGRVLSYWQGPTEAAFYIYGDSCEQMQKSLAAFLASYPLCEKCRTERIA